MNENERERFPNGEAYHHNFITEKNKREKVSISS